MQKKSKELTRLQLHRETLLRLCSGQKTQEVNTAQTTPASICDIVCDDPQPPQTVIGPVQTDPSICDIIC